MKQYNIIYADPPWSYRDKGSKMIKGVDGHYNTMNIREIKNLPIKNLADDDCILFLWTTFPLLQEGLDTIKVWGFEYKTIGFNWIKQNKVADTLFWGMGNWTRSNSELCLIGIKGKPKRISASVHSVVISKREAHSKKPNLIRKRIIDLCGDLPRLELFAREKLEGFDVWGNEVKNDIEI